MKSCDIAIVGAGIIGLSTAYQLLKADPSLKVILIEKESSVALHQTGRNSGVIHSGIYYKPGSLKAQNCTRGVDMLLEFCNKHHIKYELCGKLIVATESKELPKLYELFKRGNANGVKGLKLLNRKELQKIEPYAEGIEAIYSPNTGIVDYKEVSKKLLDEVLYMGGEILFNSKVTSISSKDFKTHLSTKDHEIIADQIINCAGLYSDKVAKLSGANFKEQILPFRGEYYFLREDASKMLNGLIYPVPDPKFPFLGVHLTRRITGEVEAGPNAVFALKKEGYQKRQISPKELALALKFKGFWAMAIQHWKMGLYELYRSYSKKAFLKDIQRLMPDLKEEHLIAGGSGVRAQAIAPNGKLIDDFLISRSGSTLNVLNAPSPGATSSLSIGETLASKLLQGCKL